MIVDAFHLLDALLEKILRKSFCLIYRAAQSFLEFIDFRLDILLEFRNVAREILIQGVGLHFNVLDLVFEYFLAVLEDGDDHVLHELLCKVPYVNAVRKLLACPFEFLDDLVRLNVLEVFDQLEYVLACIEQGFHYGHIVCPVLGQVGE